MSQLLNLSSWSKFAAGRIVLMPRLLDVEEHTQDCVSTFATFGPRQVWNEQLCIALLDIELFLHGHCYSKVRVRGSF